jgi:hypothetical protein
MDSQIHKTILCHFRKAIDFNAIENNESETEERKKERKKEMTLL